MVLDGTFSNISVISWWSFLLLMEETGVHGKNHQPATSQQQTLSHCHILFQNVYLQTIIIFFYQISSKAAYKAAPFKNKILKSFKLIPNDFIFFCSNPGKY